MENNKIVVKAAQQAKTELDKAVKRLEDYDHALSMADVKCGRGIDEAMVFIKEVYTWLDALEGG